MIAIPAVLSHPEAESAVLGACMLDLEAIVFVVDVTRPNEFTVPVNRWIAEALWECFAAKNPPTGAAIVDRLQAVGRWSQEEGPSVVSMSTLEAILDRVSDADVKYARQNAKLIHDAAFRRNGRDRVTAIASVFEDCTKTPEEVQREVLKTVGGVFDNNGERDAAIAVIAREEHERIARMVDGQLPGVTCGLAWLDELTGGFLPNETWVIAGFYKARKTSCSLNMILHGTMAGAPMSVFTVGDSSRDSTYRKLLAMVMYRLMLENGEVDGRMVPSSRTLQYRLTTQYYIDLRVRAEAVLNALPIRLYDGRDMIGDLREVGRLLRRDSAMYGTRVFWYDYAQACTNGQNDYERTVYIAGWAQQMVGELGITGVLISQVNETTVNARTSSYSPGAKGGGALPAMANVFLVTSYDEPDLTVELKLARDAKMGEKVTHKIDPPSGYILDASGRKVTLQDYLDA